MEKCINCKIKYPSEILAPMMSNGGVSGNMCGICALIISNDHLGIKRKKFQGETAEWNRLEAIEWRKKHERN